MSARGETAGRMLVLQPGQATERLYTETLLDEEGVITGTSTTEATGPFLVVRQVIGQMIRAQATGQFAEAQLKRLHQTGKGHFNMPSADMGTKIQGTFTRDANPGLLEGNTFALSTGLHLLLRVAEGPLGPLFHRNLPVPEDTPCYAAQQEYLGPARPYTPGHAR